MKRILTSTLVAALLPLSAIAGVYSFSVTGSTTGSSSLFSLPHGFATTWGLNGTSYTNLFNDINSGGLYVTSATLTLTGLKDWTGEAIDPKDALFINILSGLDTGLKTKQFDFNPTTPSNDWNLVSNPFVDNAGTTGDWNDVLQGGTTPLKFNDVTGGNNSLLKANAADTVAGTPTGVTWSDPTGGVTSTLVITFNSSNLLALTSLLDGDTSTGSPNVGLGFAAECHYYMTGVTLSVTTGGGPTSVPDSGSTLALMGLGLAAMVGARRFKK